MSNVFLMDITVCFKIMYLLCNVIGSSLLFSASPSRSFAAADTNASIVTTDKREGRETRPPSLGSPLRLS